MKSLLLILFLFMFSNTFSQTVLTKGQVYDYNVGDIMQTRFQSYGPGGPVAPPSFVSKTILSKTFSINNDSISYLIQREIYQPASCQPCSSYYAVDSISEIMTDLNIPAIHHNQTTCLSIVDSFYIDYCNKHVWEQLPGADTGCFEPITEESIFIEGLGGPYFFRVDPSGGPAYSEAKLIYYLKFPDTCGTFITEVNDREITKNKIELFPNPASDKLYFNSSAKFINFSVYDLLGKNYMKGNISEPSIPVSGLPGGIYILRLYSPENEISFMLFEKL